MKPFVVGLLRYVGILAVVSILIFLLMRVLPGDPAQIRLGVNASQEALHALQEKMGLLEPLPLQYWHWITGMLTGDFGISAITGTPIGPQIMDRLAVSFLLVIVALVIAIVCAVPIAIAGVLTHRNAIGTAISGLAQIGLAIPSFVAGILLISIFSVQLGWFPSGGWSIPGQDFIGFIQRITLPAITLSLVPCAVFTRYIKASLLDIESTDWMRTARAKGLSIPLALVRHGLPNIVLPVVTVVMLYFARMFIGAVVIETVFVLPGIGTYLVSSVQNRDTVAVQTIVMILALIVVSSNLLTDNITNVRNRESGEVKS